MNVQTAEPGNAESQATATRVTHTAVLIAEGTEPASFELEQFIGAVLHKHGGQLMRAVGNAVMSEFSDTVEAVRAAVELQRALQSPNQPAPQTSLRIGIHASAVGEGGIGAFGGLVAVAAGITRHAAPGQILISREVSSAIAPESDDLHCQWASHASIDGQQEKTEVFEVSWIEAPASIPARYKALFQIGSGGMGMVYKVRDLETGEIVALKLLRSTIADDPAMQDTLRREVCLARKVTHKNVCRIYEFNRSDSAASISMEYVAGQSLQRLLSQSGAMPWTRARNIAEQICAGLREAHLQGIVHRDLKPANVMLDNSGVVKIMDFGIARLLENSGHTTGTLAGTPAYMAPEQLQQKRIDARTDVYAIGLLLYELVTGVPAFHAENPVAVALQQIQALPKRPREINPEVPAYAESLILKCLQKDPAARFATVDELRLAFARETRVLPANSIWKSFLADFRQLGRDLKPSLEWAADSVRILAYNTYEFLRPLAGQAARRVVSVPRPHKVIATGTVALLCIAAVSAVELNKHHKPGQPLAQQSASKSATIDTAAALPIAKPAPAPSRLQAPAASLAPRTLVSESVSVAGDFSAEPADLAAATAKSAPRISLKTVAGRPVVTPAAAPTVAKTVAPRVAKAVKAHAVDPSSLAAASASPVMAEPADSTSLPLARSPQPAASAPAADAAGAAARQPAVAAAPAPAAAAPASVAAQPATAPAAEPTVHYLQVGTFKDAAWADEAVEKLTQLGYHAASQHKNVLWMGSFNVVVGPYTDPKELEAARASLSVQGFKPRMVK